MNVRKNKLFSYETNLEELSSTGVAWKKIRPDMTKQLLTGTLSLNTNKTKA